MNITRTALAAIAATACALVATPVCSAHTPAIDPVTHLNKDNIETSIKEAVAAKVVPIVKATATWCAPCQQMKPVIEQLAKDDNAKTWFLAELDVDESSDLAQKLQVHVMPTLFALKGTDFTVVQPGSVERPQDSLVKDEIDTPGDNRFIGWDASYEQKLKDWIKAKIDKSGSTLG